MSFLLRRVGTAVLVVWAAVTITFFLIRLVPGSPIDVAFGKLLQQGIAPGAAKAQVAALYGVTPKAPVLVQYGQYLWGVLHGDFGQSIVYAGRPVLGMVIGALPWTLLLVAIGLLISFVFGLVLGVLLAIKRTTWIDHIGSQIFSVFNGVPNYVTAAILLLLFTVLWPLFPGQGIYNASLTPSLSAPFIASVAYHAVLPVAAYAISGIGGWALAAKAAAMTVLQEDFVVAGNIRGMLPRQQLGSLVRNSVLPLYTTVILSIGMMFGGSVFVETLFTIPGLGYLVTQATGQYDYPVMQGAFLLFTIAVVVCNLVADLTYSMLDPRIARG